MKWTRDKLYTAFVGMLMRDGWTPGRIDAAVDDPKSADAIELRYRYRKFIRESHQKGIRIVRDKK